MKGAATILAIIALVLSACNRENEEFLWEYAGGTGTAFFISASPDSGFVSAGVQSGKPFFMKSSRKGSKIFTYTPAVTGSYRSVFTDTAFYVLAGEAGNKLFLTMLDSEGGFVWEQTLESEVPVSEVFLFSGNEDGEILALCGSGPDNPLETPSGLILVKFDTTGEILSSTVRTDPAFFRISGAVAHTDGGFLVAVSRALATEKPRGAVTKLNGSLQTIWERELSNNPSYSAASLDICEALPEGYVVSGRTELTFDGNLLMNSFMAAVSPSGETLWKKYPENSNEGVALEYEGEGVVSMLNRNCYIVTTLSLTDGSDYSRLRVYSACDSYDTEAHAEDFTHNYAGNLLLAGTKAGKYYLALKHVIEE